VIEPPPYVAVSDALAGLLAQVGPVAPRQVPVAQARGLILAEVLGSPVGMPPWPLALRDGWAVASEDLIGASGYSPVFLARAPVPIAIGEALPAGADAVLPPEAVMMFGGAAAATEGAAPGEGTRRPGEDAAPGAVLREAGQRLRGLDLAIAAAAGIEACAVRRPTLRVLGPQNDPATAWVAGWAEASGAAVEREPAEALAAAIARPGADLAVIVGPGASALEALRPALSGLVPRLALRPGEGSGCGLLGAMPVLWCPARLESVLALVLALAKPCLDRLAGTREPPVGRAAPLTRKISSALGFAEIALLRGAAEGFEPLAVGDLTLSSIAGAQAWLLVPPESEGFAAGDTVFAFGLEGF